MSNLVVRSEFVVHERPKLFQLLKVIKSTLVFFSYIKMDGD